MLQKKTSSVWHNILLIIVVQISFYVYYNIFCFAQYFFLLKVKMKNISLFTKKKRREKNLNKKRMKKKHTNKCATVKFQQNFYFKFSHPKRLRLNIIACDTHLSFFGFCNLFLPAMFFFVLFLYFMYVCVFIVIIC